MFTPSHEIRKTYISINPSIYLYIILRSFVLIHFVLKWGWTSLNFQEVRSVYQVLVAILHTGNVEFVATENNHGGDSCTVENGDILEIGHWHSFFNSVFLYFYFYSFVFEPHLDAFPIRILFVCNWAWFGCFFWKQSMLCVITTQYSTIQYSTRM